MSLKTTHLVPESKKSSKINGVPSKLQKRTGLKGLYHLKSGQLRKENDDYLIKTH